MTAPATPVTARPQPTEGRPVRPLPPVRQHNLGRVAVGTLVLVVSTLGVLALTAHSGTTRRVLVVRHSVAAGEAIQPQDLRVINADPGRAIAAIPVTERDRIVGRRAAVTLFPGTLLAPQQLGSATTTTRTALVGATLSAGQYPTTLEIGDRVLIVATTPVDAASDPVASQPVRGVVVDLVAASSSSDPTVVSLRVAIDDAPQVAAAGAGHLSLVSVGR